MESKLLNEWGKDHRWKQLYEKQNEARDFFHPAKAKVIPKVLASAIANHESNDLKILVVGGGDGYFSRKTLPEIYKELAKLGVSKNIDVE